MYYNQNNPLFINNAQYSDPIYYSSNKIVEFKNESDVFLFSEDEKETEVEKENEKETEDKKETEVEIKEKEVKIEKFEKKSGKMDFFEILKYWKIIFPILFMLSLQIYFLDYYYLNGYNEEVNCILNSSLENQTCITLNVLSHTLSSPYTCGILDGKSYGNTCPPNYICLGQIFRNKIDENSYCVLNKTILTEYITDDEISMCAGIEDLNNIFIPLEMTNINLIFLIFYLVLFFLTFSVLYVPIEPNFGKKVKIIFFIVSILFWVIFNAPLLYWLYEFIMAMEIIGTYSECYTLNPIYSTFVTCLYITIVSIPTIVAPLSIISTFYFL